MGGSDANAYANGCIIYTVYVGRDRLDRCKKKTVLKIVKRPQHSPATVETRVAHRLVAVLAALSRAGNRWYVRAILLTERQTDGRRTHEP